ncbi:MAG: hypothetical protein EZS28_015572 [Streblomastix strix]|uniref:Uncharacterized protein n=1 Tax=Streblomastix strix TaxID=222440 RepID=A0A5J4W2K5_9EUKA|nr:MAG: hypothetical protein EZS28_015572 [Streblomastix strix]
MRFFQKKKGTEENLGQSTNLGLVEPSELTQITPIQQSCSFNSNKNASIVEPKNKIYIGAVTIRIQAVAFRVIESDDDKGFRTSSDVTFSAPDIAIQRERAPLASILQKSTTDLLTVYPLQSNTTGGKITEKAEIPLKKKEEDNFAVRLRTREAEVEKDKQKEAVRTMERQEDKTQQNKR